MPKERKYQMYSEEFKRARAEEYLTTNKSMVDIEREYNIGSGTMSSWVKMVREDTRKALLGGQSNEIRELQLGLDEVRRELEALKDYLRGV